ncbi:NAD(P)H oxidoreductase YRKL at Putative NADPH-quinone reductase (modulator of drug activity B) at Flavodoxin 2 [Pediococcus damnosus]|uniref:NAD(P)H oxidoreductase YRKL at Putative NADPH-quinone reductase (Modulator of drug activity B) at Flavodoxin 2 n=1 Tax=Pediococcus damnosus TaxID=51663 RepID=A0A0R2HL72_9LACO|nr:NAD(P)H-dependent oxidoreductase [Pediococcus damnosus]AMV60624.1 NAD(P)H oxidoreductase YRKL at Putative NADPH-quinone reductase (modulator of drug activity B) at Flavodoxin 2 [Pediococcus damnosus]AMV62917.1 NAD(P)H oxidoreductase YRKL at Putative NADPH-quinone reductase (modulator of drug activity B) at Flavodoxin 2 [Pediococcus damnosus]AMV64939.1 NAD(P)H oxidoreductase YRKL at Putative NADPH-quinone reductase (modulator of drug activity B) at Flavodoxin 2 [Pediococcus damnosus]AMV67200.
MKTLVIVAHPNLVDSGTQKFLKTSLAKMDSVTWHVLNEGHFDVTAEQDLLQENDRIIFQFPLYWYSAPAILKQWEDEVLTRNFVYGTGHALAKKELGIVVSTGDRQKGFVAGGEEQFTLSELLRPYQALAHKGEMTYLPPFPIFQFAYLSEQAKQRLLVSYQQYITNSDFESFHGQELWFEQQLSKKISEVQGSSNSQKTAQILGVIQDNRENLEELGWTLSMIKDDEDE